MKRWLYLAFALVSACSGSNGVDGVMGPSGAPGAPGRDGQNAVVNYDSVIVLARPLIDSAVARIPVVQGEKGDSGARGEKGEPGQSIQGEKGEKGDKGDPGTLSGEFTGDLVVHGRLCVDDNGAGCVDDADELLQLASNGSAAMLMRSNMSGLQFQNPATHWATFGLNADGGTRITQNIRWTKNGTALEWIDPTRPFGIWGSDSFANWSMQQRAPGVRAAGQDLVFVFDHARGAFSLQTWLQGVKLQLCQTPADRPYSDAVDCR